MRHGCPVHYSRSTLTTFQEEPVLAAMGVVAFDAWLLIKRRVMPALGEIAALMAAKAEGRRVVQQYLGVRRPVVVMAEQARVHHHRPVDVSVLAWQIRMTSLT